MQEILKICFFEDFFCWRFGEVKTAFLFVKKIVGSKCVIPYPVESIKLQVA